MPVQHVKGQPAASTYVQEKGCLKKYSNCETPCSINSCLSDSILTLLALEVQELAIIPLTCRPDDLRIRHSHFRCSLWRTAAKNGASHHPGSRVRRVSISSYPLFLSVSPLLAWIGLHGFLLDLVKRMIASPWYSKVGAVAREHQSRKLRSLAGQQPTSLQNIW